ncbi:MULTISPECIES: FadR/GntR family transcriptional regulator [unclassified Microbacterium]|uniref:FadR/GntR family transcriptional regulator n=1 Tax=unclassified Microbacterium TaxID=2609290 RepID=UPI000CFC9C2C|nr:MULTISPECIES: FadR/GntR family transcriptional regulator [unclassified Microbacterium]PQZ50940.1 GntR family transcriptional regulator [Microbacterium sp. MYb43]PQZ72700.1 GntR family transcriptional regulator [Microbacterium sp. MYb40]PRB16434.1 GntR family transcriptional regulator [Microbacterium sp. MYb54]PRB31417.1 GntR family transcriptional regulator [Microbacterium sp. MYb50]PRB67700.1 GntR family transcriptional regulator [Microbacterium sp. MYb32]
MAVIDEAVDKIRNLIIDGHLHPGDRLPQEGQLAETLGISRNSLREAIRVLEQMRVLTVRHGSGTYVTSLEPAQLLEGISFAVEMMRDDTVRQVLEVRELLEPAAVRLAVQRMTPAKLADIRAAYERNSEQTEIEDLVRTDLEFHAAIVRAADNESLNSILEGLSSLTVRMRIWGGIVSDDAVHLTVDFHRQILEAIEAGDAHLAEATALLHVTAARQWLDAYLVERKRNAGQDSNRRPPAVAV